VLPIVNFVVLVRGRGREGGRERERERTRTREGQIHIETLRQTIDSFSLSLSLFLSLSHRHTKIEAVDRKQDRQAGRHSVQDMPQTPTPKARQAGRQTFSTGHATNTRTKNKDRQRHTRKHAEIYYCTTGLL
jgi:hypothetical protein